MSATRTHGSNQASNRPFDPPRPGKPPRPGHKSNGNEDQRGNEHVVGEFHALRQLSTGNQPVHDPHHSQRGDDPKIETPQSDPDRPYRLETVRRHNRPVERFIKERSTCDNWPLLRLVTGKNQIVPPPRDDDARSRPRSRTSRTIPTTSRSRRTAG